MRTTTSVPLPNSRSIADVLVWRAAAQPNDPAITFLKDGEKPEGTLTYTQLDKRARAIADALARVSAVGDRVLLAYPSGLDFVCGMFGCIYANQIAVPVAPPNRRTRLDLERLIADATAEVILAESPVDGLGIKHQIHIAGVDDSIAEGSHAPDTEADGIALLQYTSGSTRKPRGVVVTHGNLMANLRMIGQAFHHPPGSPGVSWLPMHHDMGLIGCVLAPVYLGAPMVYMTPAAFIQKPRRWLQAISDYQAFTSGAPNFAYELCVASIVPGAFASLDLSCWKTAFVGAEPVRNETLERFAAAACGCGFRRKAFLPCYGLAEATLLATECRRTAEPLMRTFETSALEQNRVVIAEKASTNSRPLISCGRPARPGQLLIVDPQSLEECASGHTGEIWLSGPHIAARYWNTNAEGDSEFDAYTANGRTGPFLRTGDLGFVDDGDLFITGRLKDLIIVNGRNHSPQDVEYTVEESHPAIRVSGSAAFALDIDGEPRVIVAAEVDRRTEAREYSEIIDAVRRAVAQGHELSVFGILLLKHGSLPKTGSGKVRRQACGDGFLNGTLDSVTRWQRPDISIDQDGLSSVSEEALSAWLCSRIGQRVGFESGNIDPTVALTDLGIDSVAAVEISGELQHWLGREVSPLIVWEYPSIAALSRHLASVNPSENVVAGLPEKATREPIAIIGTACRFPGAGSPLEFWKCLIDGVDAISEQPDDRVAGAKIKRRGGYIQGADQFDADFFRISPREASRMDPQQRLLLAVCWEALENAALVPSELEGSRTGVFVGISGSEHTLRMAHARTITDGYCITGNAVSLAANRISYALDLQGPSLSIDTACSSSLAAAHLACQSLHNNECTLAIAAGASLLLYPDIADGFGEAGALSPDGQCKPFDAGANGIVRGEGVGAVVLKPLSQARRDGDPVYAVIRGSAINQDGRTNGITAPNPAAQKRVLREAYRNAGVDPGDVQYVETHGTGTLLGDPIEASALGAVLSQERPNSRPCLIGSVKSNIGHLEAAAGIAGLIKTALALDNRRIPPSLHFKQPNPNVTFEALRLRVADAAASFANGPSSPLAGVSAFGFGGTNVHMVLEGFNREGTGLETVSADREYLIPLSARSSDALHALAARYAGLTASTASETHPSLRDMACTLGVCRTHQNHRLAIVARTKQELAERLHRFVAARTVHGSIRGPRDIGSRPKLAFVFSGYGSQWRGMGRGLLEANPCFRRVIAACDELLRPHLSWNLLEALSAPETDSRLDGDDLEVTQLSLFAVELGLATVWREWGITPDAVVGHSLGETVAACVAGALSLSEAVQIAYHRARLLKKALGETTTAGGMIWTRLAIKDAEPLLRNYSGRLSLAAHNSSRSLVITGDRAAIEELHTTLRESRVDCQMLNSPGAGHSPGVESLSRELVASLSGLQPQACRIPFYSTVSPGLTEGHVLASEYWGRNVRQPVLFADAVETMIADGFGIFLEIGPDPALSPSVLHCLKDSGRDGTVLPSLRRNRSDSAVMLQSLAILYAQGYDVRWREVCTTGRRVHLPSSPWRRQSFGLMEDLLPRHDDPSVHPLLGKRVQPAAHPGMHVWESEIDLKLAPFLAGHRVRDAVVFPAAGYIEMVLSATLDAFGVAGALENLHFRQALFLPEDTGERLTVQLVISQSAPAMANFRFFSHRAGPDRDASWRLHAEGSLRLGVAFAPGEQDELAAISGALSRLPVGYSVLQNTRRERRDLRT